MSPPAPKEWQLHSILVGSIYFLTGELGITSNALQRLTSSPLDAVEITAYRTIYVSD